MVLTVFFPAARPELLHPHFVVTCPARSWWLLRHRGRNLHFTSGNFLRRVDISSHQGSRSRQATPRPAGLNVDPEVGGVGRLPCCLEVRIVSGSSDLPTLRPPGHGVLPDPVLLAAPVVAPADLVECVLRVSLPAVRPRAEPPGRGEPRVGVLAASLLPAVERVLHCGAVQRVVVVVAGVLQAGVRAGLVLPGLTVPLSVVTVVRVMAVFVSPSPLAVLHLVISPRHVCVLVVWCWGPLQAILHTFNFGRVEAEI